MSQHTVGPAEPVGASGSGFDSGQRADFASSAADGSLPLGEWWAADAAREAETVVPKAIEYGAGDLKLMGEGLALMYGPVHMQHLEAQGVTVEELACAFYLLGKIARACSAYADGRRPHDDTFHDAAIYARMIKRLRVSGTFPGPV